jgi:hypothetical protein
MESSQLTRGSFKTIPASEETTNTQRFEADSLAGGPGFEPTLTESESAILALNYPPPERTVGEAREWHPTATAACAHLRRMSGAGGGLSFSWGAAVECGPVKIGIKLN